MIFLLFAGAFHLLPRQESFGKVDQDVTDTLKIVSSRMLNSQVRVDRSVTSSTSQSFVFLVRNMVISLSVSVLLGQTEIDQVDDVGLVVQTYQKVIWLDVSMDVVPRVAKLYSGDLCQSKIPSGRPT